MLNDLFKVEEENNTQINQTTSKIILNPADT